jgi:hypothetical protein
MTLQDRPTDGNIPLAAFVPGPGQPGTESIPDDAPPFHCGVVAIVGRPNVGKSTLLNNLVRLKLSAVRPKPRTTRQQILRILHGPDYQAVF